MQGTFQAPAPQPPLPGLRAGARQGAGNRFFTNKTSPRVKQVGFKGPIGACRHEQVPC